MADFISKKYIWVGVMLCVLAGSIIYRIMDYDFEHKIVNWIEDRCVDFSDLCVIKMTDLTSFRWDEMYFFENGAIYNAPALEALGLRPDQYRFLERKIIFVENKKVILHDELDTHIEHGLPNQIYFDVFSGEDYKVYTPQTAIFTVQKNTGGDYGPTYYLTRVSN
ncbi:MAG: hypothetical protein G01um101418_84 [Parcubacteria group bacterium Gr01-1014_18]|nr:MAG: hypothetical protein Greene041636_84 [Parcubacteria group bacterium Greene0416_36]TSC81590.1 MAG: hypothetical protein G01um101418_84 [Parcubacteria group bacterium Gr01-1014_18]TSC99598.1 MAG: hypothetical protein Greene101420_2 [Parcubacteria group bacterium Greene1014_20]TSD06007.1 MAG: hypothetical protein Greene07142_971 [Parcubacteria group bacterium Greene0714_2]